MDPATQREVANQPQACESQLTAGAALRWVVAARVECWDPFGCRKMVLRLGLERGAALALPNLPV